jgi:hypothetical protein
MVPFAFLGAKVSVVIICILLFRFILDTRDPTK